MRPRNPMVTQKRKVLDIGHIGRYTKFKQMFEYLAINTACQMLSEYCHGGKILLIFYYNIVTVSLHERGRGF